MQEDKLGKVIKEIRKKNNLTQKDLADKYHVTYQAVSKWENGKNLPDLALMKEISKDFNVSLDDMMDGNLNVKSNKKNILYIIIIMLCVISLITLIIIIKGNGDSFESSTISSMCKDYKISGVISYNKSKSAIYIPKIEYCGDEMKEKYNEISCTLYEKDGDINKGISNFLYKEEKSITIEEFMKLVNFNVDNYLKICNTYKKDSFYLEIKAIGSDNKMFFHTIPLTLDDKCE